MTEAATEARSGEGSGAILRAEREKQGIHIAALAASLKVTVAKLEALEADRFDELPDATFARALALTVCRSLKIDPAQVLARLPQGGPTGLGRAGAGLNTPFREHSGRSEPNDFNLKRRPLIWLALLVLLGALAIFFLPARMQRDAPPMDEPTPAADIPAAPDAVAPAPAAVPQLAASAAAAPAVEVVHSVPADADPAASQADASAAALVLRAQSASWVEVVDASGRVLLSRTLQPGERVAIDGNTPFRLKVGNAATTQIFFRGAPVDLTASTVGNVARLELK